MAMLPHTPADQPYFIEPGNAVGWNLNLVQAWSGQGAGAGLGIVAISSHLTTRFDHKESTLCTY